MPRDSEGIVFTTPHGKYYHLDPACGRWSLTRRTRASALAAGKVPCGTCAPTHLGCSAPKRMNPTRRAQLREKNYLSCITRYRSTERYRWSVLKTRAKKRNIRLTLDSEAVIRMLKEPCAYCGRGPTDRANGLDRLDNEKGYTMDNVVPCCRECNRMKWVYSVRDFLMACRNVTDPASGTYDDFDPDKDYHGGTYSQYTAGARRRGHVFTLTREKYSELRQKECHYCRRPATSRYPMGIDRRTNSTGYREDNAVPCCARCNRMKSDFEESFFRDLCSKITNRWAHLLRGKTDGGEIGRRIHAGVAGMRTIKEQ
jgi:hypothetical protein